MNSRHQQVRSSATWAAYGDALGFVTELADRDRVLHRSGQARVETTVKWTRKVGGRTGGFADFPAGTYSDDTQLRLATSRAIRRDGSFDVAAFAKVELPAWLTYALGAGIGSREAASNLARTSATWYTNFFENKRSSYFNGGGNGAAMRIQPHVWAARDLDANERILRDVIRNSVVTHGHPRGIIGSCFHALTLASAMKEGKIPNASSLSGILDELRNAFAIVEADRDLRTFWIGRWLEYFPEGIQDAFLTAVDELKSDILVLSKLTSLRRDYRYEEGVKAIGGFDPSSRGSGTKTALLAWFLSDLYRDVDPSQALADAVNTLGSDTDTIATMAGALIGATTDVICEHALQDRAYIENEADRLAAISMGENARSFDYPDLRSWKPTRVAADAIYETDGELFLSGIGPVSPMDRPSIADGSDFKLSWFELAFGQTLLARSRLEPTLFATEARVAKRSEIPNDANLSKNAAAAAAAAKAAARLPDLFATNARNQQSSGDAKSSVSELSLHNQLQIVIASGFDKSIIGQLILAQVDGERDDFVERAIGLTSNIVTAYAARVRRKRD